MGDELGGHIVSGHVDGVAEVVAMRDEGDSTRVSFRAPEALARFIAPKGSVALNGTSLTVNEVEGAIVRRQPHPAHQRGDDLGRRRRWATGSTSRSTRWRATWRGCRTGRRDERDRP